MDIEQTTIGRRPEVSDKKIIEAGKKLISEGKRVTGFGLRRAVGSCGDSKRLFKVWEAHMSTQTKKGEHTVTTLPVELEETLNSVINDTTSQLQSLAAELNLAAVKTAEQRVAAAVELANEREQAAEAEVHDASITIDDLEAQLTSISIELAQCKQALQLAKGETEGQIKLAGEFNLEVATLAVQLNSKEKEVENHELSLAGAQQRIDNSLTEISELKSEKIELRAENKRLVDEISKISNERDKKLNELIAKLDRPIDNAA